MDVIHERHLVLAEKEIVSFIAIDYVVMVVDVNVHPYFDGILLYVMVINNDVLVHIIDFDFEVVLKVYSVVGTDVVVDVTVDVIDAIVVLKNLVEVLMDEDEMDVPVEVADDGIISMVEVENVFLANYFVVPI